ncbi:MAG: NAD(P)/FAD-dependent oxidoreductase [Rubrivivax sp.]
MNGLPARCEVLVVGAGPAGSACAQWLARHGVDTLLVDQHDFPRDKTCGDGLIPDAHAALKRLGVHDEVMARAQTAGDVRCVAPSGRHVDVPGTLAVLPRRELDHLLVQAAQRAGAVLATPWRFEAPLRDESGRVTGARLRRAGRGAAAAQATDPSPGPHPHDANDPPAAMADVQAGHVVLATGAAPQALVASGLCDRRAPSAMGLRGYIRHEALERDLQGLRQRLEVFWHRRLKPGYGWIFPCPGGVYNIGVGIIDSHRPARDGAPDRSAMRGLNLRDVFADFTRLHAPARALVEGGTWVGRLEGAPLRSSLQGARWAAPGILVTGEAAGSTYSFTGEGIGKAMETGLLAAEALLQAGAGDAANGHGTFKATPSADAALAADYTARLARLKPKFALYERGNTVNHHPWLTELLVRRAAASPAIRRRMSDLLEERATPAQLITLRGMVKLLTS